MGIPITGRIVRAATVPARWAARPAAATNTAQNALTAEFHEETDPAAVAAFWEQVHHPSARFVAVRYVDRQQRPVLVIELQRLPKEDGVARMALHQVTAKKGVNAGRKVVGVCYECIMSAL